MDTNLQQSALDPELQKAITSALAILIPALVSWIVSKLTTKKEVEKKTDDTKKTMEAMKKDTDAAFLKLRVHEGELGIQTKVVGGEIHVTSHPGIPAANGSLVPGDLHSESGGKGG